MPEGDTLRKLADFMAPRLLGRTLTQATVAGVAQPELARRKITAVRAQGKHLVVGLAGACGPHGDDGWVLRVHLGMHGSWHSYPVGAAWQRPRQAASVVLNVDKQVDYVCFYAADAACQKVREGDVALARLGPNLLLEHNAAAARLQLLEGPAANTDSAAAKRLQEVVQAARARPASVLLIDLLLDQSVAAGFGNVYKSELLFYFGLAPSCTLGALSTLQLQALYARGMHWLAANLGGWPRTTTVDRRVQALPLATPRLYVYARAKLPCLRCRTPIVRALLGRHRRSTYSCPRCQAAIPTRF